MITGILAVFGMFFQLTADLEAVHAREHEVEQEEIGRLAADAGQGLAAVGRAHGLVAGGLEIVGQELPNVLVVLDDHDGIGGHERLHKFRRVSTMSR
jgi:hypothetical protein